MNREQFKKNLHRHFRIQPALQLYEDTGILRGSIDDAWIVWEVTDKGFTLRNRASDHCLELGFDSYVEFREDPGGKGQHQTDGILILKAQLYMHEGVLKFAATIAPGKELREFTPPGTRQSLFHAARQRRDEERLQALREEFASRSLPELRRAFSEIGDVIEFLKGELRAQDLDAEIFLHRYGGGYLLGSCGWWVTVTWQDRGHPRDSYLSLVTWHGRPNVPGMQFSVDQAEVMSEQKYHFGLARPDEIGWIAPTQPDIALSTRTIFERLLAGLFNEPNREPAPIWRLPGGVHGTGR